MTRRVSTEQARIELPITREGLPRRFECDYARICAVLRIVRWLQDFGLSQAAGAQLGAMLRPISTPLVMNGFEPESTAMLASAFGSAGFIPVVGGAVGGQGGAEAKALTGPLREGGCRRRLARRRRSGDGCDRNDHAHRRQSHLRVRPSILSMSDHRNSR
jgi:hypothetical protein